MALGSVDGACARVRSWRAPSRTFTFVALAASACLVGCGDAPEGSSDGEETGGEPDEVIIAIIEDAPSSPTTSPVDASISGGPITELATSGTEIFVATVDGPAHVVETNLDAVEVVTDGTTPPTVGTILEARTIDGTAMFRATEGVFANDGDRLIYHPLSSFIASLDDPNLFGGSRSTDGTLALWILSSSGDYRLTEGMAHQWTIPQFTPDAGLTMAVESEGVAILAQGDHLVELTYEDASTRDLETPMGEVRHGVRDETARLYVGGEHGILVRTPEGELRHYTLGAVVGDTTANIRQLVARPGGGVYALVGDSVIILDDEDTRIEALLSFESAPSKIAADGYGHLWVVQDGGLTAFYTGEPVSFATSVAPILGGICNACHQNDASGAVLIDWTDYDEASARAQALGARTKDGSMPPPGTGFALASVEIATIDRWISTGTLP